MLQRPEKLGSRRRKHQTPDPAAVTAAATAAERGISGWFALVPAPDVQRVDALFRQVRAADTDRNGRLSSDELATLPPTEQSVWSARVKLYGD